ncbi:histone H3.1 [Mucor velutinosus]|uniref:Histone H3.1 n=1 Tax=Mucor velutinosus TaxID=708070 RepID=A0AAN7I092_9FUNG|nr:histone H3.1 [Mucor velutinosus]
MAKSTSDNKDEQLPSKQQKKDQVHILPVSASSPSSSNTKSNAPNVSSPISITEVLASSSNTVSHAPYPIRHYRKKSVDLTSQFATSSTLSVYSRLSATWLSLPLNLRTCTRTWYVVCGYRALPKQPSSLGFSSFVPSLPEIPEEASEDESLDIGSERQVHSEDRVTVYSYDSIKNRSIDKKNNFYQRELK